ncbi:MAG TPA: alkaline phosphatase family protein, partial [Aquaticitalea sp.]|nr:alkaline phosphatase family protein [Aquaticitalea sp.]
PHRMRTTTFADENRLFTQLRGKTIGIALKDRGAILPAGHTANAAYWFHGKDEGNWISSSFYMDELPKWVNDFNNKRSVDSYLKVWDTYYDIATYTESGSDLNTFEGGFKGKETATFPYDLATLKNDSGNYDILKATAYGNNMTTDFAIAAIEGEQLGKDMFTDVLTVSYSSTDYVGHNFGVNSKEIQDTYIRLDKELERLFNYLDANVGKNQYTVFLTADHAAVEVPAYLSSLKIPSGYFESKKFREDLNSYVAEKYGEDSGIIENVSNFQVFLNRKKILDKNLKIIDVQQDIADYIIAYKGVDKVYISAELKGSMHTSGVESLLQMGYNQKRSGDIAYVLESATISYSKTGSTHGSAFNYDTHVPLLLFGKGIKHGHTFQKTVIPDIAPTISALLGIGFPSGATGQPLEFVFE